MVCVLYPKYKTTIESVFLDVSNVYRPNSLVVVPMVVFLKIMDTNGMLSLVTLSTIVPVTVVFCPKQ
jgi:hypothetical protein